jgi:hypothetical protein
MLKSILGSFHYEGGVFDSNQIRHHDLEPLTRCFRWRLSIECSVTSIWYKPVSAVRLALSAGGCRFGFCETARRSTTWYEKRFPTCCN